MKKLFISTLASITMVCCLFGQHSIERQVIASAGGFGDTGSHLVSSTVGETATASFIGGSFQLTQGFQQSSDLLDGVADLFQTVQYKFYPNPTPGDASLEMDLPISTYLDFKILDLTGKTILEKEQEVQQGFFKQAFDLNHLKPGTYFLQLKAAEDELLTTIKFIRI